MYVQQDLIEELLKIFNCKSDRSVLNEDDNYRKNRNIRNILVGHPINKKNGKVQSSTIFTNRQQTSNISYMLYKRDNNFRPDFKEHSREEIIARHNMFIESYTSEVYDKCLKVIRDYKQILIEFQNTILNAEFKGLIRRLKSVYGIFFESYQFFDFYSICEIYDKKNLHYRYQFAIESFYSKLKKSLAVLIDEIDTYLSTEKQTGNHKEITFSFRPIIAKNTRKNNQSNYIEKLHEMNEHSLVIIDLVRKNHFVNDKVQEELKHMELNINNNTEYYLSLHYLKHLLDS